MYETRTVETRPVSPLRSLLLVVRSLFIFACVLVAIFAIVGYASGWISWERDHADQKARIEIDTAEMKVTADKAIDEGKELINEAGEALRDIGNSARDTVPTSRPAEPETAQPGREHATPQDSETAPAQDTAPSADADVI